MVGVKFVFGVELIVAVEPTVAYGLIFGFELGVVFELDDGVKPIFGAELVVGVEGV